MTPSEADGFWRGGPRRPFDGSETSGTFGEPILRAEPRWNWLEELRLRFDLGVEVLDADLEYVFAPLPDNHQAVAVRATLEGSPQILRDTAALAARSTRPRSSATGGITVAMFPLSRAGPVTRSSRPRDRRRAQGRRTGPPLVRRGDRRLDEAGRWLVAAIEVALQASTSEAPELKVLAAAGRRDRRARRVEPARRSGRDRRPADGCDRHLGMTPT